MIRRWHTSQIRSVTQVVRATDALQVLSLSLPGRRLNHRYRLIDTFPDQGPCAQARSRPFEHRFVSTDRVIGVVAIRGVFKGADGPLDPGVLLAGVAHAAPSPELPEWANRFHQSGELLSELLREEERLQGVTGSKR